MEEAREEADRFIDNCISDEELIEAINNGEHKLTLTTELENIHTDDYTWLERVVFGDKLSKETTYYFED